MDKVLERTDTFLVSIDKLFQVCTILRRYSRYLSLRAEWRGKIRTHVKQLFLDKMQRLVEFANRVDTSHVRPRYADGGVRFVDRSKCLDPQVMLLNAPRTE